MAEAEVQLNPRKQPQTSAVESEQIAEKLRKRVVDRLYNKKIVVPCVTCGSVCPSKKEGMRLIGDGLWCTNCKFESKAPCGNMLTTCIPRTLSELHNCNIGKCGGCSRETRYFQKSGCLRCHGYCPECLDVLVNGECYRHDRDGLCPYCGMETGHEDRKQLEKTVSSITDDMFTVYGEVCTRCGEGGFPNIPFCVCKECFNAERYCKCANKKDLMCHVRFVLGRMTFTPNEDRISIGQMCGHCNKLYTFSLQEMYDYSIGDTDVMTCCNQERGIVCIEHLYAHLEEHNLSADRLRAFLADWQKRMLTKNAVFVHPTFMKYLDQQYLFGDDPLIVSDTAVSSVVSDSDESSDDSDGDDDDEEKKTSPSKQKERKSVAPHDEDDDEDNDVGGDDDGDDDGYGDGDDIAEKSPLKRVTAGEGDTLLPKKKKQKTPVPSTSRKEAASDEEGSQYETVSEEEEGGERDDLVVVKKANYIMILEGDNPDQKMIEWINSRRKQVAELTDEVLTVLKSSRDVIHVLKLLTLANKEDASDLQVIVSHIRYMDRNFEGMLRTTFLEALLFQKEDYAGFWNSLLPLLSDVKRGDGRPGPMTRPYAFTKEAMEEAGLGSTSIGYYMGEVNHFLGIITPFQKDVYSAGVRLLLKEEEEEDTVWALMREFIPYLRDKMAAQKSPVFVCLASRNLKESWPKLTRLDQIVVKTKNALQDIAENKQSEKQTIDEARLQHIFLSGLYRFVNTEASTFENVATMYPLKCFEDFMDKHFPKGKKGKGKGKPGQTPKGKGPATPKVSASSSRISITPSGGKTFTSSTADGKISISPSGGMMSVSPSGGTSSVSPSSVSCDTMPKTASDLLRVRSMSDNEDWNDVYAPQDTLPDFKILRDKSQMLTPHRPNICLAGNIKAVMPSTYALLEKIADTYPTCHILYATSQTHPISDKDALPKTKEAYSCHDCDKDKHKKYFDLNRGTRPVPSEYCLECFHAIVNVGMTDCDVCKSHLFSTVMVLDPEEYLYPVLRPHAIKAFAYVYRMEEVAKNEQQRQLITVQWKKATKIKEKKLLPLTEHADMMGDLWDRTEEAKKDLMQEMADQGVADAAAATVELGSDVEMEDEDDLPPMPKPPSRRKRKIDELVSSDSEDDKDQERESIPPEREWDRIMRKTPRYKELLEVGVDDKKLEVPCYQHRQLEEKPITYNFDKAKNAKRLMKWTHLYDHESGHMIPGCHLCGTCFFFTNTRSCPSCRSTARPFGYSVVFRNGLVYGDLVQYVQWRHKNSPPPTADWFREQRKKHKNLLEDPAKILEIKQAARNEKGKIDKMKLKPLLLASDAVYRREPWGDLHSQEQRYPIGNLLQTPKKKAWSTFLEHLYFTAMQLIALPKKITWADILDDADYLKFRVIGDQVDITKNKTGQRKVVFQLVHNDARLIMKYMANKGDDPKTSIVAWWYAVIERKTEKTEENMSRLEKASFNLFLPELNEKSFASMQALFAVAHIAFYANKKCIPFIRTNTGVYPLMKLMLEVKYFKPSYVHLRHKVLIKGILDKVAAEKMGASYIRGLNDVNQMPGSEDETPMAFEKMSDGSDVYFNEAVYKQKAEARQTMPASAMVPIGTPTQSPNTSSSTTGTPTRRETPMITSGSPTFLTPKERPSPSSSVKGTSASATRREKKTSRAPTASLPRAEKPSTSTEDMMIEVTSSPSSEGTLPVFWQEEDQLPSLGDPNSPRYSPRAATPPESPLVSPREAPSSPKRPTPPASPLPVISPVKTRNRPGKATAQKVTFEANVVAEDMKPVVLLERVDIKQEVQEAPTEYIEVYSDSNSDSDNAAGAKKEDETTKRVKAREKDTETRVQQVQQVQQRKQTRAEREEEKERKEQERQRAAERRRIEREQAKEKSRDVNAIRLRKQKQERTEEEAETDRQRKFVQERERKEREKKEREEKEERIRREGEELERQRALIEKETKERTKRALKEKLEKERERKEREKKEREEKDERIRREGEELERQRALIEKETKERLKQAEKEKLQKDWERVEREKAAIEQEASTSTVKREKNDEEKEEEERLLQEKREKERLVQEERRQRRQKQRLFEKRQVEERQQVEERERQERERQERERQERERQERERQERERQERERQERERQQVEERQRQERERQQGEERQRQERERQQVEERQRQERERQQVEERKKQERKEERHRVKELQRIQRQDRDQFLERQRRLLEEQQQQDTQQLPSVEQERQSIYGSQPSVDEQRISLEQMLEEQRWRDQQRLETEQALGSLKHESDSEVGLDLLRTEDTTGLASTNWKKCSRCSERIDPASYWFECNECHKSVLCVKCNKVEVKRAVDIYVGDKEDNSAFQVSCRQCRKTSAEIALISENDDAIRRGREEQAIEFESVVPQCKCKGMCLYFLSPKSQRIFASACCKQRFLTTCQKCMHYENMFEKCPFCKLFRHENTFYSRNLTDCAAERCNNVVRGAKAMTLATTGMCQCADRQERPALCGTCRRTKLSAEAQSQAVRRTVKIHLEECLECNNETRFMGFQS